MTYNFSLLIPSKTYELRVTQNPTAIILLLNLSRPDLRIMHKIQPPFKLVSLNSFNSISSRYQKTGIQPVCLAEYQPVKVKNEIKATRTQINVKQISLKAQHHPKRHNAIVLSD